MVRTHYCPQCSSYSGDTFEVIKYGANGWWQNEWLRCKCGWEGQWKNAVRVEESTESNKKGG